MEKIYMEENKKQKKSVVNFSVVLSFVVAIFAVFSLAMFGIVSNQGTGVSYAAVTSNNFTLKLGNEYIATAEVDGTNYSYSFHSYYANSVDAKGDNRIFCIERSVNVSDNQAYTNSTTGRTDGIVVEGNHASNTNLTLDSTPDVKDDPGLVYLLGLGSSEDTLKAKTGLEDIDLNTWILQSAIWYYLAKEYPSSTAYQLDAITNDGNNQSDQKVLDSSTILLKIGDGQFKSYSNLTSKVKELVGEANVASIPQVIVAKSDDEVSKTDDGKYYQSALITVIGDPSANLTGYDIELSGIEGAIAVDENGDELTLTNVSPSKKFYVRIPAEKATEEVQKVKINIIGHFNSGSVLYYKTGDDRLQRMASVSPVDKLSGIEVEFVTTGDTGMNAAQTIYFIGLIVLLCGVGIVYANAKTVEAKQ